MTMNQTIIFGITCYVLGAATMMFILSLAACAKDEREEFRQQQSNLNYDNQPSSSFGESPERDESRG